LVKLKITGVREIAGNLTITFTHPLDTPVYASQGIQVSPTSFTMGTTSGIVSEFYQQFGASDYLDIVNVASITGGTASNALTGQISTRLYQNILYSEIGGPTGSQADQIEDGDTVWLDAAGTNILYLDTQTTVDRDQFNVSYVRSFNNIARQSPDNLVNYPNFGTVYASDNIGFTVGSSQTDIVSSVASINQFLDVLTKIDTTSFTFVPDQINNKIISVGDYLVSTDLELCETVGANRQSRLTKVTAVAQTTTSGVVRVVCARPILFYSGSPVQVQKFKSIPQFT
jgi:hypothetical protein